MDPDAAVQDGLTEAGTGNRVLRMPEVLANKIAAGEVVQRPASVLKELVENALDAGARNIEVTVAGAGSDLIQVVDDGEGMSPADAVASFDRHATSKIKSIDDLTTITTLGFRGEALASIAAVARVSLKTVRRTDSHGTEVRFEGGRRISTSPCALESGTSVAVRSLFFNVPARRKFLRTPATELKHLVDAFLRLAMSNPDVAFKLTTEERTMYDLRPHVDDQSDALRKRIADIHGTESASRLIPVQELTSYLSLTGFLGSPEDLLKPGDTQHLFVNGRFVRSRYLSHAVRSAYEGLLPDGAYPYFVLFLETDPRHVDVNVHPTKEEVKFDDERGTYSFMRAVVKKSLGVANLIPQFGDQEFPQASLGSGVAPAIPGGHAFDVSRRNQGLLSELLYRAERPIETTGLDLATPETVMRRTGSPDEAFIWQLDERYIVSRIRSGLFIVDQQAAHERVLYEQLMSSLEKQGAASQQLLFPQSVDLSPTEIALAREMEEELRAAGFDLEFFSGRSVVVRGVPTGIKEARTERILQEVLEQYQSGPATGGKSERLARSIATRTAIEPGTRLGFDEMQALIDQLLLCEVPYVSPSGRRTIITIAVDEIDSRFGR